MKGHCPDTNIIRVIKYMELLYERKREKEFTFYNSNWILLRSAMGRKPSTFRVKGHKTQTFGGYRWHKCVIRMWIVLTNPLSPMVEDEWAHVCFPRTAQVPPLPTLLRICLPLLIRLSKERAILLNIGVVLILGRLSFILCLAGTWEPFPF